MDFGTEQIKSLLEMHNTSVDLMTSEEKTLAFKENIVSQLSNLNNIGQITLSNLERIMSLLSHENVIVPYLPIFRYKGRVMSMGLSSNDNYEVGKHEILTVEQIQNYLDEDYIVFIYNVNDVKHEDNDNLTFVTKILRK